MLACVRQQNNLRFAKEALVVNGFQGEIADDHNFRPRLILLRRGAEFVADEPHFLLALPDKLFLSATFTHSMTGNLDLAVTEIGPLAV